MIVAGLVVSASAWSFPGPAWLSLDPRAHVLPGPDGQPSPARQPEAKAKRFGANSLQLRNDIANEPTWEAVFSDREVNAWLAEELVTHFADQLPPEVHDPGSRSSPTA